MDQYIFYERINVKIINLDETTLNNSINLILTCFKRVLFIFNYGNLDNV